MVEAWPSLFWVATEHIYLCVAYLAPDSSSYAKNAENFKEFKNGIDRYASLGHLAVIGDLNARVGTRQETVMSVNEQGINSTHGLVNKLEISKRNSEDNTVNARGQKLFDLATNYELFLADGRSCGDLTGKYTCCQWNGQSVVDVFMAQSDVLSRINYFEIGKFDWYSDHAPISVDLAVDIAKYIEPPVEWKKVVKQLQRWDNDAKAKMKDTLIEEPFVSLLEHFAIHHLHPVQTRLTRWHQFYNKRRSKHHRAHCNSKIPFSHEIQIAKRIYRKSKRLYDKNKTSITRRQNYIIEKKKYRKAIYKAKKIAQEMKLNRLAELEHSDPKRFWADVTRIIRPRDDSLSCIEPWKWYKHFQSLLRPPAECDANSQFSKYVSGALPTLEVVSVPNNDLNKSFIADEIKDTIKVLKIGKATFVDELSNELFKFTFDTLCRPLLHLFNTILSVGDFPSPRSEGLIVPIHKKNDRLCVDNYRGIIISSCIGKVFIKILTKRIHNFMIDSGKWKINQCGFKPDHLTEDNLFIIKSIHESYAVETNTNIHTAFIDFSKFFDTIDRMCLFYKLLKKTI